MTPKAATLEELAERAAEVAAAALRTPPLDMVRAMLNEAGVPRARGVLGDGLDRLAEKQTALRTAQEVERDAKAALDTALVAAEWELDSCFLTEGNKTYLVTACSYCDGEPIDLAGNPCPKCKGEATDRKAMTADERAKWKATEARKNPGVAEAAKRLRIAEHETATARDAAVVADKSLSAARADLEAAVATLTALSLALPTRNGDQR